MPIDPSRLLPLTCEAAQEVLETMFFTTAAPAACAHAQPETLIAARVGFAGRPAGELSLTLSCGLARALAAGFLGVDFEELSEEAESQIACELANILCGAILSRVHPDCGVALEAPQLIIPRFEEDGRIHQCFLTPDGALTIALRLEKEPEH